MGRATFAARSYRATALVLRTQPLGEADRIITLLSAEHGVIRAVAKGIRKTSSRFGASLEPFTLVEVQLVHGRSLDILTQAQTRAPYGQYLAADYNLYTAACAMAETAERLTSVETGFYSTQYRLFYGAVATLAKAEHDAQLILDSYLLRALAAAGWAPSFTDCVRCGAPGPHSSLNVPLGGVCCPECRPPGSQTPSTDSITLLAALLVGDWAIADGAAEHARWDAAKFVNAFVHYHLERQVKALAHVQRANTAIPKAPTNPPAPRSNST